MSLDWLFSPETFYPLISPELEAFLRVGYGIILIATLLITLPNRRFFLSERWGGYAQSAPDVDWIQNPLAYPLVQVVWIGCGVLLIFGYQTVLAALVNLLLCRYFFVYMRWKGVARGMGAPGYMSYWMGLVIFALELARVYAPDLQKLFLLAVQIDLAMIMLSAGFYKLSAGYAHKNGMELGAANPEWGFWSGFYSNRPPHDFMMQTFNQLAWGFEILAAVFMLMAPLRFIGGLMIFFSFAFLVSQIRLGWLAQLVMLCSMVFFHPGSLGDKIVVRLLPAQLLSTTNLALNLPEAATTLLAGIVWLYIILLPLAHLGLSYNFYLKKRLPGVLQPLLERYTNFFGMIVWRVFSQDLVSFYPLLYHQPKGGGERQLITVYGWRGGGFLNRYNHVCESIVLTTLFTTLKYYPSNPALFKERMLRYSRTVPHPPKHELVYEYIILRPKADHTGVAHIPIAEFIVDVAAETVVELPLTTEFSPRDTIAISPVHEGSRPGSYVPLQQGGS